ncbi:MAG: sigma 54-interacting transcriptional regulator [Planctomycetota bacterium]|jgi:PAS domain S-box-containing protein|nr:sigma 54-interacting transcriptional regulator [Planctomycetota bacterium]
MKEIAVVTPFSSMAEVTRRVVEEYGYANVDVLEADPDNVLLRARQAIDGGARVIVSRGGFFELIRSKFDVPVVEIKVTAFDLIDAFGQVKRHDGGEWIGIMGFRNVIYGAEIIANVMNLRAVCREVTNDSDIAAEMQKMLGQGIRTFVGDNNVKLTVAAPGCRVFLVHSGNQAMQMAIQQARDILYASRQQKEKAQQFAAIIDFVHDGIVAIDNRGCITVFNSALEKITGFSRQDAIGKRVTEVIPESRLLSALERESSVIGDIQTLNGQTVVAASRIPVVVDGEVRGAVSTYQDITDVQRLEQKIRIQLAERGFVAQYDFSDIIHRSAAMAKCIRMGRKFAQYDTSVLIFGPSGVGKELFAQSIHNNGARKKAPFVAINCAALPETLIESELFGYAEGSFTGAIRKGKAGLFEIAHGGTIFLDEISELPLLLQGRLLRVLQEKQVMRLGDNKLIPVDVRIICATNRDLRRLVESGQFRGDLYFRIAILSLYVPPLNDRAEDIELLSAHFLKEFSDRYRKEPMSFHREALDHLCRHDFRGNVRELRGMVERAVVLAEGRVVGIADLEGMPRLADETGDSPEPSFREDMTLKDVEDAYIGHVFRKTGGSIKASSAILGVGRTTLWRRIRDNGRAREGQEGEEAGG